MPYLIHMRQPKNPLFAESLATKLLITLPAL